EATASRPRQMRDVGDAAEVQHDAIDLRIAEQFSMQRGNEWRALAAGGHVLATEISDDGNARQFRDRIRIANLHRERMARGALWRLVPDSLAMTADCGDAGWRELVFLEQRICRCGEQACD